VVIAVPPIVIGVRYSPQESGYSGSPDSYRGPIFSTKFTKR